MYSRRDFGKIAVASIPLSMAAAKPNSMIGGVQLGAQSNSFSGRPLDDAIKAMVEIGMSECELWQGHVEPRPPGPGQPGVDLRKWREETPPGFFGAIARKFRQAGILLYAYDYSSKWNLLYLIGR